MISFSDLLFQTLSEATTPTVSTVSLPPLSSGDEENALRYACGYLSFKLLKRYSKLTTEFLCHACHI